MLIFEITKTNTPLPQKGIAPYLEPPHSYVAYATQTSISSVKQSKTNVTSCLHWTQAAWQNTVEVIVISDAFYTGCSAWQIPDRKLLRHSIYDLLTQISKDFQWSIYCVGKLLCLRCSVSNVDTVLLTYREERKQPRCPIAGLPLLEFSPALESLSDIYTGPNSCLIVLQKFSSFVFYPQSLSFCRSAWLMSILSTERSLLHIMSRHAPYCCLATSLFWYSAPDSVF